MNQDEAKQAVQDACADGLKKAFGILASNLINETPEQAAAKFKTACANHLNAYDLAIAAVEDVFRI